jgi:dolichyl-phosphate-mannose-protein mannosyltransferase
MQVDSDRKDTLGAAISAQIGEPRVIGQEEKVEYRDQDGNMLDEAQVQALLAEGKASFSTKYETRTRLVDEDGNLVDEQSSEINPPVVAPDHPDVEGQNPSTKGVPEEQANKSPPEARAGGSVKEVDDGKAKPASDASAATK